MIAFRCFKLLQWPGRHMAGQARTPTAATSCRSPPTLPGARPCPSWGCTPGGEGEGEVVQGKRGAIHVSPTGQYRYRLAAHTATHWLTKHVAMHAKCACATKTPTMAHTCVLLPHRGPPSTTTIHHRDCVCARHGRACTCWGKRRHTCAHGHTWRAGGGGATARPVAGRHACIRPPAAHTLSLASPSS